MSQNYKYRFFQYYRDYYFYKKIDLEIVEAFATEVIEKGYDNLYAFIMTLICRYYLDTNQKDLFTKYLNALKEIATEKGGYSLVYVHINEGLYQMMMEQNHKNAALSFQEGLQVYQQNKLNHPPTIYNLYQFIGVAYCNIADYITAYQYLNKALDCDLNETFKFHKAMTYNWLAIIEDKHHLTSQALQKALKSAEILKKYSIENRYCDVLNTIGLLYADTHQYNEAEASFTESIEIATKYNMSFIIADGYNNLGLLYKQTNQNELALKNYLKSLEYRNQEREQKKYAKTLSNIGNVYINLEEYDKAEKFIQEAIDSAIKLNDEISLMKCYSNISIVYLKKREYKKVEEFLKLAETIAINKNEIDGLTYIYKTYSDLYNVKQEYKKMSEYTLLYAEKTKENFENKLKTTVNFIKG